jgi:hypothetical protein
MNRIFAIFLLVVLIPAAQLAIMVVILVTVVEKIVSTWWVDEMLVQRSYEETTMTCMLVYVLLISLDYLFLFIMYWIKNSNYRMILTLLFWIVPSAFCANQFLPLGNSFVSFLGHLCYNGVYYLPFLLPDSLGLIKSKMQLH